VPEQSPEGQAGASRGGPSRRGRFALVAVSTVSAKRELRRAGDGVEELRILADVVTRLEAEGIRYAITGSVAMSCYVVHRTTVDTDIVVQLVRGDAQRVVSLFEDDYYVDQGAVDEAIRLSRSFNVIHFERLLKVDLIVAEPTALMRQRFERRRRLVVEDTEAWVLAPEDLILAKLEWARISHSERQISDVRTLLDGDVDIEIEYLDRSAATLGLTDLLEEARR